MKFLLCFDVKKLTVDVCPSILECCVLLWSMITN